MTNALVVAPYDPRWEDMFEEERVRLEAALLGLALRIDHNGSTSVPGLPAKPIIDIQVSVARLHPMDGYRVVLRELGYRHVPHPDDAFCPFFHRSEAAPPRFTDATMSDYASAKGEFIERVIARALSAGYPRDLR